MMEKLKLVAALALFGLLAGSVSAAENELGWTLDSALKQIDRQSKDFDTLLAEATVTARGLDGKVTREFSGRMYMNKNGDIRIRENAENGGTGREMLVTRSEVQEYNPALKQVDRYSLSKHKNRMEPYARLGFANTGKDLKDDYLVTMRGEDTIRGERTLMLELTPKKDSIRQIVSKVTLWINEASWMPMRQVIEDVTNQESLTVDYRGSARNLSLNPNFFKAKWPRGTKRVSQ